MASCSNVLYQVERCSEVVSNIRKGKYRPATTTTTTTTPTTAVYVKLRGPPWILKLDGMESSGQRQISSITKTKGLAFTKFTT